MLKGRLGLARARVPHVDRHGIIWLGRGRLYVDRGTLRFGAAEGGDVPEGTYEIPYQLVSCLLLMPGTAVTHDALRLLHSHGTGLVVVGDGAVRMYASLPAGPGASERGRRHARLWADKEARLRVARRMYAWRFGESVDDKEDIAALRGIEGARARASYKAIAASFGIQWRGRRYDRNNPMSADLANQAVNHAAVAVRACGAVAVAVSGALPSLGFIHEESNLAFALDVADLYRDEVVLPVAFGATREVRESGDRTRIEPVVRKMAGRVIRERKLVATMIDRIKELFDGDDSSGDS